MYICENCGIVSEPREPMFLKTIETREVTYKLTDNRISKGSEIVKQIRVCKDCK